MLFDVLLGVPVGKKGTSKMSTKPTARPAPRSDEWFSCIRSLGTGVLLSTRRRNCRAVQPSRGNRQKALLPC